MMMGKTEMLKVVFALEERLRNGPFMRRDSDETEDDFDNRKAIWTRSMSNLLKAAKSHLAALSGEEITYVV